MLEAIERILGAVTPLLVAITTIYGGVLVAKINNVKKAVQVSSDSVDKIQRDIITNHGSRNIGDAVDRLTTQVAVIADSQRNLLAKVESMQDRDETLDQRLSTIEGTSKETNKAVTETIRVVKPMHRLIDKIRSK